MYKKNAFCLCLTYRYNLYLMFEFDIMGNVASRIVIGSFYLRTKSVIVKNVLVSLRMSSFVLLVLLLVIRRLSLINVKVSSISTYLDTFVNIINFTTLFFGSDAAENPGPETQIDEVSLFLLKQLKY